MDAPPKSTMRRDIVSAYVAAAAKVGSWATVAAMIYRSAPGSGLLGIFSLVRATVGLLNYTSLGIAPAMIQEAGQARKVEPPEVVPQPAGDGPIKLDYQSAVRTPSLRGTPLFEALVAGSRLALRLAMVGIVLVLIYAGLFDAIHTLPPFFARNDDLRLFVYLMGSSVIIRLLSEPYGAVLQIRQQIALDNAILTLAEIGWIAEIVVAGWYFGSIRSGFLDIVAWGACFASVGLFIARRFAAGLILGGSFPERARPNRDLSRRLLKRGAAMTSGQLADFLYAPTDFILINELLGAYVATVYAPAVQIDAALLLSVTAIATVLFPKAALAHSGNDHASLRRYFFRGTLASAAILLVLGGVVWLFSGTIFKLWLGDRMRETQAILPLLLIHTIIGGSGMVGRSILLGMGKVKPFTIAVLVAGVSNVILSFSFVYFFHMGLKGIVLGTICAVVGRCAIWQPWYILRVLRHDLPRPDPGSGSQEQDV